MLGDDLKTLVDGLNSNAVIAISNKVSIFFKLTVMDGQCFVHSRKYNYVSAHFTYYMPCFAMEYRGMCIF